MNATGNLPEGAVEIISHYVSSFVLQLSRSAVPTTKIPVGSLEKRLVTALNSDPAIQEQFQREYPGVSLRLVADEALRQEMVSQGYRVTQGTRSNPGIYTINPIQ